MNKMQPAGMVTPDGVLRVFRELNSKLDYSVKLQLRDSAVVLDGAVFMDGDKARVRLRADAATSISDMLTFRRVFRRL